MKKYSTLLRQTSGNARVKNVCGAVLIAVLVFAVFGFSACVPFSQIRETESKADLLPQPNPYDGITYVSTVTFYHRFADTDYLVPIEEDITISSNELPEAAILRALLSDRKTDSIYTTCIPEDVELIDILESDGVLFVTLSSSFVSSENYESDKHKRIAVCEIVNTLAAYEDYSIQILIDNDGSADRVSYSELGFDSELDKRFDYAAPFGFMKNMVAAPHSILEFALRCLYTRDYETAVQVFVKEPDKAEVSRSDLENFCEKYRVMSYSVSRILKGKPNEVLCTVTFETIGTGKEFTFRDKVELIPYGQTYKVQYESITAMTGDGLNE